MPHSSSDEVVRAARDHRLKQIEEAARRASKKILSKMKSVRLSAEALTEPLVTEFQELAG